MTPRSHQAPWVTVSSPRCPYQPCGPKSNTWLHSLLLARLQGNTTSRHRSQPLILKPGPEIALPIPELRRRKTRARGKAEQTAVVLEVANPRTQWRVALLRIWGSTRSFSLTPATSSKAHSWVHVAGERSHYCVHSLLHSLKRLLSPFSQLCRNETILQHGPVPLPHAKLDSKPDTMLVACRCLALIYWAGVGGEAGGGTSWSGIECASLQSNETLVLCEQWVRERQEGAACYPVRDGCLWLNRQGSKRCWNRGQIQEKQRKFATCMQAGHMDLILSTSQQWIELASPTLKKKRGGD